MKTVDHYLNNKFNKERSAKSVKPISTPIVSPTTKSKDDEAIFIDFPEEKTTDNYPVKKTPLINKPKVANPQSVSSPPPQTYSSGPVDLIKRKKRYEESPAVVLKCSECGTINAYAKKTSNNSDITNVQCGNCIREVNLRGYLSFSENPFYQRTQDNAEWFDQNIQNVLMDEKPRFVKF